MKYFSCVEVQNEYEPDAGQQLPRDRAQLGMLRERPVVANLLLAVERQPAFAVPLCKEGSIGSSPAC